MEPTQKLRFVHHIYIYIYICIPQREAIGGVENYGFHVSFFFFFYIRLKCLITLSVLITLCYSYISNMHNINQIYTYIA